MGSNITKKQHYITASYIAQFSDNKKKKLRQSEVFYYDTRSSKILYTKSENLHLAEDWYFEINSSIVWIENNVNLVEKQLTEFESKYISINKCDFSVLNSDEKDIILHFMLHLYLRSPRKRKMILENLQKEMDKKYSIYWNIKNHKDYLEYIWKKPDIFDKINTEEGKKEISKMLHSASVLWFLFENPIYNAHLDIFNQYNFQFIKITNDESFISGDNPVIYWSRLIIFPVNSKSCLIWYLKSYIWEQIKIDIEFINISIASNSDNLIFWANQKSIEKYKNFIINKDLNFLRYLDL